MSSLGPTGIVPKNKNPILHRAVKILEEPTGFSCHGEVIRRILEPGERSREIEHRRDVFGRDAGVILQNRLDRIAAGKRTENLGHENSRTPDHRTAVADIRIDFDSFIHDDNIIPKNKGRGERLMKPQRAQRA